jgi:hypothetical protein
VVVPGLLLALSPFGCNQARVVSGISTLIFY